MLQEHAVKIKIELASMVYSHRNNVTFCVGTGVTVLGILVYLLLANDAFGCPIRSPSAKKENQLLDKCVTKIANYNQATWKTSVKGMVKMAKSIQEYDQT